jgi:predicted RNA-binding Zn-ribbon protein involved in translation (DUF1610 family)
MDINACPKCGNIEIAETVMQSGPHYSRIDCPDCGFIKWGKKPRKESVMADNKVAFLVGVPATKRVEFGLGEYEREQLLKEYSKTHHEFSKMLQWFDDLHTSPEQREKLVPTMREMFKSCMLMLDMMERAGISDKMLVDDLSLPF